MGIPRYTTRKTLPLVSFTDFLQRCLERDPNEEDNTVEVPLISDWLGMAKLRGTNFLFGPDSGSQSEMCMGSQLLRSVVFDSKIQLTHDGSLIVCSSTKIGSSKASEFCSLSKIDCDRSPLKVAIILL